MCVVFFGREHHDFSICFDARTVRLDCRILYGIACVAGVERGRGRGNLGAREGERKGTPARTLLLSPFFTLRF